MAQAMLRLLARPKITAVFCVSFMPQVSPDSFPQMYSMFLSSVEGFLNFFNRITQNYRSSVGAAHRAIGFCESGEQPFHFCLVERHIYFDGGVARGGGGDFGL